MPQKLVTQKKQNDVLNELLTLHKKRRGNSNASRLSGKVFEYVVSNIRTGNFEPATKLVERELAEQMGISHVPVREAIEKLEQLILMF